MTDSYNKEQMLNIQNYTFAPFEMAQSYIQARQLAQSPLETIGCAVANSVFRFLPQTQVGGFLKGQLTKATDKSVRLKHFIHELTPSTMDGTTTLIAGITTTLAAYASYNFIPHSLFKAVALGLQGAAMHALFHQRNAIFSAADEIPRLEQRYRYLSNVATYSAKASKAVTYAIAALKGIVEFSYPLKQHYLVVPFELIQTVFQIGYLSQTKIEILNCMVANMIGRLIPQTEAASLLQTPFLFAHQIKNEKMRNAVRWITPILTGISVTAAAYTCFDLLPHPVLKAGVLGAHATVMNILSCNKNAFKKCKSYEDIYFSQKNILEEMCKRFSFLPNTPAKDDVKKVVKPQEKFLSGIAFLVTSVSLSALGFHPITTNALAYSCAAITEIITRIDLYSLAISFYASAMTPTFSQNDTNKMSQEATILRGKLLSGSAFVISNISLLALHLHPILASGIAYSIAALAEDIAKIKIYGIASTFSAIVASSRCRS